VAVLVALLVGRAAWAVDMPNYRKHITKFHQLLEKAQRARSKGDLKEADKLAAKADEEKALADVALNSPPKLLKINEPGPVVNYEGPYYGGYRGWGWNRRDPWWGYPYRRW
jgi:hypothetical protein